MTVSHLTAVALVVFSVASGFAQSIPTQPALVLPFPGGTRSQCVQGPGGAFSHRGNSANDLDLDTPNDRDWRVLAAASGVAYAHPDSGPNGFGNHVNVDHGNGYFTVYAHLKTILISDGTPVVAGSVIGMEDSTGKSQGDHLHFGLHQGVASSDAKMSRSVPIERLRARDASVPGSGFVEVRGTDLVCALPGGHIYESDTAVAATVQTIFNNFGPPSNPFDVSSAWVLGDRFGYNQQVGLPFTVPSGTSVSLSRVTIVPLFQSGVNQIRVSVHDDAGGLPGAVLESWLFNDVAGIYPTQSPVVADSLVRPALQGGGTYWVVLWAPDGTFAGWSQNSTGDYVTATNVFALSVGSSWFLYPTLGVARPVAKIEVTP